METIFKFKEFEFDLRTRQLSKAEEKVHNIDRTFHGYQKQEEVMFLVLKSGQSRKEYDQMLEECSEDEYLKIVFAANVHYSNVIKKMKASIQ